MDSRNGNGNGNIIWLASYPKSGNTWFRAFYTNLITDGDSPAPLDALLPHHMASSRCLFDDYAGVEASDLVEEEIEQLRPRVYEAISNVEGKDGCPVYIKIHDAYTHSADGCPLVSREASRKALYFLRNPLDVAVSFAHHSACDYDKMIADMGRESFCFCGKTNKINNQLRQRLLSWSSHVTGWVEGMGESLHLVRYEDMVLTPVDTFTRAARFAQLPDDPARIQKALLFSDISELQKLEQAHGFKEKPLKAESFFRKGKIGSWREALTDRQVQRIIEDHRVVMKRFGYLNEHDEPVF